MNTKGASLLQDCLHAGASDKVKSLGIRSGDLIWVMAEDTTQLRGTQRVYDTPSTCQVQSTDGGPGDATCSASIGRVGLPENLATAVHQILLDGGMQHIQVRDQSPTTHTSLYNMRYMTFLF